MADSQLHPTRVCNKCGVEKPATREFFPPANKALRSQCRPCWRERDRAYFWANREKKREAAKRRWANADKAEAKRKLDDWRAANPAKVKATERRRIERIKADPELRATESARQRRYRQQNPEKTLAAQRSWQADNRDKTNEYCRRWYHANRDTALAKDREYRRTNYEKIIAQVERRRARQLEAEGSFTGHDVVALLKRHGRVCFYCGERIKKFELDHFIPLARGGTNWPDNLAIACKPCNASKGAKMPWEWKPGRFTPNSKPYR